MKYAHGAILGAKKICFKRFCIHHCKKCMKLVNRKNKKVVD